MEAITIRLRCPLLIREVITQNLSYTTEILPIQTLLSFTTPWRLPPLRLRGITVQAFTIRGLRQENNPGGNF